MARTGMHWESHSTVPGDECFRFNEIALNQRVARTAQARRDTTDHPCDPTLGAKCNLISP